MYLRVYREITKTMQMKNFHGQKICLKAGAVPGSRLFLLRCVMSNLIRRRDAVSRMSDLLMMELQGKRLPTWNEVYQAMNDVPSAEPEPKWIPFTMRELTTEEKEEHPEWDYIMDCELPDDGEEILVSNGKYIWCDTFVNDCDGCYLDGDTDLDGCAWMPLPEPWRGE